MKKKYHMWLLAFFISLSSFAVPLVAQAHWGCCRGGTGMMYNQEDGKYYPVPSAKRCVVYRAVDDKMVPVARCCSCHYLKHHKHHRWVCRESVKVRCEWMPGHWMGTHWFAPAKACMYYR